MKAARKGRFAPRAGSAWQPIDTAPKDGTWVILYDPKATPAVTTGIWDHDFWAVWNDAKQDTDWVGAWTNCHVSSFGYEELVELNPTHWMPLPESPNATGSPTGQEGRP